MYFLPVTELNLKILNLSNKVIDGIVGCLEKALVIKVDISDKFSLYDKTPESFTYSTKHLIWLICHKDYTSDAIKNFNEALNDQYQNITEFISERVSFPISFLTYNWNTII